MDYLPNLMNLMAPSDRTVYCLYAHQEDFQLTDLFDVKPMSHILNPTKNIRMSTMDDLSKVVIYSPHATEVYLDVDVIKLDWTMNVLRDKRIAKPEIFSKYEGSAIKMPPFNSDVLLIGKI